MEIGSKVRQIHHMQSKDGNAYSLINAGKVRRALEHAPHTGEPEFVFGRSSQNRNCIHKSRTTYLPRFSDLLSHGHQSQCYISNKIVSYFKSSASERRALLVEEHHGALAFRAADGPRERGLEQVVPKLRQIVPNKANQIENVPFCR